MTVKVQIWGALRDATGGLDVVEVEARNFKQMLDELCRLYPGLAPRIEQGVSMALDGKIYREAWFQEIRPENEVVLMPYMAGG